MDQSTIRDEFKILLKQIGINLSKSRVEKGWSQKSLGELADKHPSVISKVESYAPVDISLRNIYEVARLIPVSLGEIISKSEKELDLYQISKEPKQVNNRLSMIFEKIADLSDDEQLWVAEMMEGLLARTGTPIKRTDRTDKRLQNPSVSLSI